MRTVTAALLALATAIVLVPAAQAAYPGKNGRIAYVDWTGMDPETGTLTGSREIWTAAPNDTDHRRLTTNDANEGEPVWSPDGRRIAFSSDRTGTSQIFTMREDGTGVKQVTRGSAASSPTWSPDGHLLAFIRDGDIWIGDVFGLGAVRLTRTTAIEASPAWSPRGFEIAYTRGDGQFRSSHIWTIRITGTHARDLSARSPLLPEGSDGDYSPAWSPDGRWLIFPTHRGPNTWQSYGTGVWKMRADGTRRTMLADGTYHGGIDEPAYAPDGTQWIGTTCLMGHCWLSTFAETEFLDALTGAVGGDMLRDADWQPIPCRRWPLRC